MELLKDKSINDVLVIGGGVIPMEDIPALKDAGIAAVFTPGTPTTETIEFIKNNLKRSV
jgi:methylmalonyl-CoA mutase C-terminal domain/subunit